MKTKEIRFVDGKVYPVPPKYEPTDKELMFDEKTKIRCAQLLLDIIKEHRVEVLGKKN